MPRPDKNGMIDGYMAVQTVRRSSGRQQERQAEPHTENQDAASNQSGSHDAGEQPRGATFGHTALPTRHDIACYGCGYNFVVTGRLDRVICPKCRTQLATGDKTVCGPFSGTIKTVGTVTIHNGAHVTDSEITASVIRIAGICERTRLQPGKRVELDTGATVDSADLSMVDVLVDPKAQVHLQSELQCRSLHIEGSLNAKVRSHGTVTLCAQASFRGTIEASGLVVEDGARLSAQLAIIPNVNDQKTQE